MADGVKVVQYIKKRIRDEMGGVELHILSGACESYEQYKFYIGLHQGMSTILEITRTTLSKYDEDDDDDA